MSKSFLGRGWKFPVEVDSRTGRIKMSDDEEDVAESIKIIMSTSKGERVMRPDFGCGINSFTFGMSDVTTLKLLESNIRQSIMLWEPRVNNVDVEASFDNHTQGKIMLNIRYNIRSTNNIFNIVYPFYINEGVK